MGKSEFPESMPFGSVDGKTDVGEEFVERESE